MSRDRACEACGGTGMVAELSIAEKITFAFQVSPHTGLFLRPDEVAELLDALGVPAPPAMPPGALPAPYPPPDTCTCEGRAPHVHITPPEDAGGTPE